MEDECSSNTDDDDDNHKDEEEPHDQPGPASLATQPPQVMESMQDAEMNEVVDEERNEDEEKTLLQKLRHLLGEKTILLYGDSVTEELGEKYLKKNNINYEYAEHNVMRGAPPEEINKQVSTPQGQLKDDVKEKLSRVEFVVVSAGKNIMRGNLDEYVALDVRNKMLEPMLREKPADLPLFYISPTKKQFVREPDKIAKDLEDLEQAYPAFKIVKRYDVKLDEDDFLPRDPLHLKIKGNFKLLRAIVAKLGEITPRRVEAAPPKSLDERIVDAQKVERETQQALDDKTKLEAAKKQEWEAAQAAEALKKQEWEKAQADKEKMTNDLSAAKADVQSLESKKRKRDHADEKKAEAQAAKAEAQEAKEAAAALEAKARDAEAAAAALEAKARDAEAAAAAAEADAADSDTENPAPPAGPSSRAMGKRPIARSSAA